MKIVAYLVDGCFRLTVVHEPLRVGKLVSNFIDPISTTEVV
jgi:hypothetical protein